MLKSYGTTFKIHSVFEALEINKYIKGIIYIILINIFQKIHSKFSIYTKIKS